jgi:uncharacterized protein
MTRLSTPGVYVELVDPPAPLDPVAVDVAAFVAVCERGPVDEPVRLASWPQFESTFGTFVENGIGAYALKAFFDNGGRVAHVVRVAAPELTASLTGPQPPDRRSSVLDSVEGFVLGAAVSLRQLARTWMHLVADVDPVTQRVTWDRPLHPDIDLSGMLPLTIATGAGTADALFLDEAGTDVLRVTAAGPGAFGNHLSIAVEPRFDAATVNRPEPGASTAATPVRTIDGFTANTLARITQDAGGPLVVARRVISLVDAARSVLWWDIPLPGSLDPTKPFRIEAETFALSVRERGRLREVHEGLSMVPGHARFAERVLAGSAVVRGFASAALPPPASGNPAACDWTALSGGRDGTAALSLPDLLGDELAEISRGLAVFALVDEPALVAMPDLVAEPVPVRITPPIEFEPDPCVPCPPPPPPPDLLVADVHEASASFDDDDIARAQQALVDHCERRADRVALLDPPAGRGALDVPPIASWRTRFDSSYAALYAPWVEVLDPLAQLGRLPPWGRLRRLPPSGHVAGCIARVDAEVGPWVAPANRLLRWAHSTDVEIGETGHGALNDADVDVLRAESGRGVAVLGARTVASDASWRFLNVRRLFLLIERTFRVGLSWTVFEPAGLALDRTMAAVMSGLLHDLWERGAFAGETPDTSFFVHAGGGDQRRGEVVVSVGIAALHPAEVILLQVARVDNRLEITEQPERSVMRGRSGGP